jgi:hypothetical protein
MEVPLLGEEPSEVLRGAKRFEYCEICSLWFECCFPGEGSQFLLWLFVGAEPWKEAVRKIARVVVRILQIPGT